MKDDSGVDIAAKEINQTGQQTGNQEKEDHIVEFVQTRSNPVVS